MTTTIKKLFTLLTALCLALSMAACGKTPVEIAEISLPETFELTVGDAVDPVAEANFWADREDLSKEALLEAVSALALTWTTEDEAVAFIDANGALCAAGEGETMLTVISEDGALTATADVVVHAAQEEPVDEESVEDEPETEDESEPVDSESEAGEEVDEGKAPSEDESESETGAGDNDSEPASTPVADSKPQSSESVVSTPAAPSVPESAPNSIGSGASVPAQPTCPDCGATDHTVHPTCPTCGATDHTVHPAAPAATCPSCGSTEHTTHPVEPGTVTDPVPEGGNMDNDTVLEVTPNTGENGAGNAEIVE